MSDFNQIDSALNRLFHIDGHRLVFWNDPERHYLSSLPQIHVDGVTTLRLDQLGALEVKIRLEQEDPTGKYLLYSPTEEPDYEDDWLLDIRLYSRSFRADRPSMLLQELGLANQYLRSHLAERRKFFDSKERIQRLKLMVTPEDLAADLDRKMMAVIVKADLPELFHLLRTIYQAWDEADVNLDDPPEVWIQIEKFDLDHPFWQMVKAAFGYGEENPTLKNLLLRMMVTDFAYHLKADVPSSLRGLVLPPVGWSNTVVCLAAWRDSNSKGGSYDRLSLAVASILQIEKSLSDLEVEQLVDVMTFLDVEKRIASGLREQVHTNADTINAEEVRAIAARRQAGHWASLAIASSAETPREALHAVYTSIVAAADLLSLRNLYRNGFDYPDASALYHAYETELYRFDQLYRHFHESANAAEGQGWNILKSLRDEIENHYVNWYLVNLVLAWGQFIEQPDGLMTRWQIDKVAQQYKFYDRHVKSWLDEGETRRAFVIISDAFRYEAAQELTTEFNGKYRFEATLTSQLGVLPSYTAIGMASLLPHQRLAYKDVDVLVDGQSSRAGSRGAILEKVGGLACKYDELMGKKKEEGREFIRDKRVVYVYHNTVDAIGDDAKTEEKTFEAVRTAIEELSALVAHIINNLNGNYVVVTADHGFLFTETARVETDKSSLKEKPEGAILAKKRYLIGEGLRDHDSVWHGKMCVTAKVDGEMEFWIPKGANLFHFVGGARFVHGGAMPQEIVIPVITVKHIKGKSARETSTRSVMVQVLGANHRITTTRHRFQLIQMEPVSERLKPITLKVAVYEGDTPVSDVQTMKFESSSGNLEDRKSWVSLVLKDRPYNKKTPYRLVLRDAATGVEHQSLEVIIDRAFTDDF